MINYDLSVYTAIVTGGAQGIGYAVAKRMIASGARVRLWDIDEEKLGSAVKALGSQCDGKVVDVTDYAAVEAAAAEAFEDLGGISILVNSAGVVGEIATVETTPVDDWAQVMRVNLDGTFHCCRAVVPHMKADRYGRIVNMASVAGKEGNMRGAAYSASKAGVIALTKSLGKELANMDIAVNCITPSGARTRLYHEAPPDFRDYMLAKIPRGRFAELEEIASMVCWLSCRENSFATGAVFDISGGRASY